MSPVDEAIGDREVLQIDHSQDGREMRVVVGPPPERCDVAAGPPPARDELLVFRFARDWVLVHRGPASASLVDVYGAFAFRK